MSARSLVPGRRVPAVLKIERRGFDGLVNLDVLNLPHGVIVDDIGLNAVQILEGQNARQIFLYCAPWVGAMERDIFAVARVEGDQASRPIRLRILPPAAH